MKQLTRLYKSQMRCESRSSGFTYLSVIILVAIIGIVTATTIQTGSALQRYTAEEDLLEIGTEFRNALISYANASPVGQKRNPASLQDLLKDPRYPSARRHLRKLYADPITGKEEWGTVKTQEGDGIIGIHSLSSMQPIKIGNFGPVFQEFEGRTSYREWKFMTSPTLQPAQPTKPSTGPQLAP